jgi:nucleoside-diphosphate-sugar epimerase
MRSKKLIIGCGYLGRRVAARWIDSGCDVIALTRSEANAVELRAIGTQPIIGDVMEPDTLASLPNVETVLYAVGLDRRGGHSQRAVYVDGLANVLSQVAPASPKFLYISSTSVYGQNAGEWVDETSECRPDSPNGQVCLEAEQLLRRSLPSAMILRLAGIYGPGRLVARAEQLRAGTPLTGNPEAWLNLIHVDDAATAVLACERVGEPGSTVLVSDDRPHSRREYYAPLASLIGAPVPRFDESTLDASERTRLNKRCCNRKLREELGVELRYATIVEGLPEAVEGKRKAESGKPPLSRLSACFVTSISFYIPTGRFDSSPATSRT